MANENIVLEHLRHIRSRVDQIADDMGDVKLRLNALERGQAKSLANTPTPTASRPDSRR